MRTNVGKTITLLAIFAAGFAISSSASRPARADDFQQALQELQGHGIFSNPSVQKYVQFVTKTASDPAVARATQKLLNHPRKIEFLFWEIGWVLLILGIKLWRTLRARGVLQVIFVQLWTLSLFLFGVFFLVPRLVFGEPYAELIRALVEAVFRT